MEEERLKLALRRGDRDASERLAVLAWRREDDQGLHDVCAAMCEQGERAWLRRWLTRLPAERVERVLGLSDGSPLALRLACAAALGWCPWFVEVPAGRFLMGASPDDPEADSDEHPCREVTLRRPLYVASTSITQGQWTAVMKNTPSLRGGEAWPVGSVSWHDAIAYCQGLSARLKEAPAYDLAETSGAPGVEAPESWDANRSSFRAQVEWSGGGGVRLPTEAEWEYAARAGDTSARYGPLEAIAWFAINSEETAHPVGQKQANAWGLHDMLGNVWEWCWDHWDEYYPSSRPSTDPRGVAESRFRVLRGGGYTGDASSARASARNGYLPELLYASVGFRCVIGASRG